MKSAVFVGGERDGARLVIEGDSFPARVVVVGDRRSDRYGYVEARGLRRYLAHPTGRLPFDAAVPRGAGGWLNGRDGSGLGRVQPRPDLPGPSARSDVCGRVRGGSPWPQLILPVVTDMGGS
jgi:hypothetical protein